MKTNRGRQPPPIPHSLVPPKRFHQIGRTRQIKRPQPPRAKVLSWGNECAVLPPANLQHVEMCLSRCDTDNAWGLKVTSWRFYLAPNPLLLALFTATSAPSWGNSSATLSPCGFAAYRNSPHQNSSSALMKLPSLKTLSPQRPQQQAHQNHQAHQANQVCGASILLPLNHHEPHCQNKGNPQNAAGFFVY